MPNPVRLAPRLDLQVHRIDGQSSHYVNKCSIQCSSPSRSGSGSHRIEATRAGARHRLTRNAATAQRWAVHLSGLNVQLKPLLNGVPSHRPSETIRQQRLIWFKTGKLQPGTDVLSGFLLEGYGALLSAFA